jgi:hypothetical protein
LAAVMQASAAVRRMHRSLHSPSPVLATAEVIISNSTIAVETLPDTRTVCKGGESIGGSDAGFSGSEEAAYKLSQPFPGDSHDAGRHCIPTRCSCTIPGPLNSFFFSAAVRSGVSTSSSGASAGSSKEGASKPPQSTPDPSPNTGKQRTPHLLRSQPFNHHFSRYSCLRFYQQCCCQACTRQAELASLC